MLRAAALLTACCVLAPGLVLAADPPPAVDDARAFLDRANAKLLEYFASLKAWLDQQNAGATCGR